MATASPNRAISLKQNIAINPAKVDQARLGQNTTMPVDILSDLQDSFAMFDKDETGFISIQHFKNILHNFGFSRLSLKDYNDDLRRLDPEFAKRTGVDFEFLKYAVSYRWNKTGQLDEAREAFKLFDKRERNFVNGADLKTVLGLLMMKKSYQLFLC